MRIRVNDPKVLAEVAAHFERAGFSIRVGGKVGILEVRRPDAPIPEQERRDVEVHLRVWRAMYPDRQIDLLEDDESARVVCAGS